MLQQEYGKKCLNSTQCNNYKLGRKSMRDNPKSGDLQPQKTAITLKKRKLQFVKLLLNYQ